METVIIGGLFTLLGIIIQRGLDWWAKREDKYEQEEQELSQAQLLDHQILAQRTLEKLDKAEIFIKELNTELRSKEYQTARLDFALQLAQRENKELREQLKRRGN